MGQTGVQYLHIGLLQSVSEELDVGLMLVQLLLQLSDAGLQLPPVLALQRPADTRTALKRISGTLGW